MESHPQAFVIQIAEGQQDRLQPCSHRQLLREGYLGRAKTGPNPTDRGKKGTKHHLITDAQGIPLAVHVTEANRHDVTAMLPLVEAIPPIGGKPGRPQRRPEVLQGDAAYHSSSHQRELRRRVIKPLFRQKGSAHGSGLGKTRWVVERTLSWLHQNRRLRVRYEKRADIHEAFLILGCIMICWSALVSWSPLC
jgi:transposase